jgi:hypothetical protein
MTQPAASRSPLLAVFSRIPPFQVALQAGQVVRDENLMRQFGRESCHVLPTVHRDDAQGRRHSRKSVSTSRE